MSLASVLAQPSSTLSDVVAVLSPLDADARTALLATTTRAQQRRLYALAAEGPPATLEDFVAARTAPRTAVVHEGRNTLPLPAPFRRFQKIFCRPDDGSARLFGFNEGVARPLSGPGYYVAVPCADHATWAARGAVVVDYYRVPDAAVVDGWPKVVANSRGLQILIYHHTRDFMRKLCDGVTVGAAYKGEHALDHYFTLVRRA